MMDAERENTLSRLEKYKTPRDDCSDSACMTQAECWVKLKTLHSNGAKKEQDDLWLRRLMKTDFKRVEEL